MAELTNLRHFVRRAALRAASSSPSTIVSKSRSINTASPFLLRSKVQNGFSTSVFRRFASDEANASKEESAESIESADGKSGYLQSAIDSASEVAETATTYASEATEQVKEYASETGSAVTAAPRFAPRENNRFERREPNSSFTGRAAPADRVLAPSAGIYVGNLLFDVTAADLTKEFQQYGTIKSTVIASDARGLSKG